MKGKRPVLIYFCYQPDSEVSNTGIYSAVFLASPYYNYLKSTASTTMICWLCHSNSVTTGSSLPNISAVKTRKRRNMIGIDIIRSNRINCLITIAIAIFKWTFNWMYLTQWANQLWQTNKTCNTFWQLFVIDLFLYLIRRLSVWTWCKCSRWRIKVTWMSYGFLSFDN